MIDNHNNDKKTKEDIVREFAYARMAKGKLNETYDLIKLSKWTPNQKMNKMQTETKNS